MNFIRFTALSLLLLIPASVTAQYGYQDPGRRWDPYYGRDYSYSSQQLNNAARRLSNTADSLWNMIRNRREYRDPQRVYLYDSIRDFARTARLYRSNPSDGRARQLINQAENISRFVDRTRLPYQFRNTWFALENDVALISRYHGLHFDRHRRLARRDPYYYGDYYGYNRGVFRWRGRVDGSDIIYLRGNRVDYRHLQARPLTGSSFDLSSPLPRSPVNMQLRRIEGRGEVRIIQQPSRANNYTAGVLIQDDDSGADFYEFELLW